MKILRKEAQEFVVEGTKINIVNPQSAADHFNGKYLTIQGKRKLDLTRLDYLGLGSSPQVKEAMIASIRSTDISCPASQMITKTQPNEDLERALAHFHGMKESIVFTSGYSANENIIQALGLRIKTPHISPYVHETGMGKSTKNVPTVFFIDEESHFSVQYPARIGKLLNKDGCIVHKFPSMDYEYLRDKIEKTKSLGNTVKVIISDTLSSTSGRIFDLKSLYQIADDYDCLLYLDEAHAVGAMGPQGRGIAYEFNKEDRFKERTLIMGTLTKVFCQLGGYVTMLDKSLNWFLRVCSPQYLFSAPVPPWMAQTIIKIVGLIEGDFGDERRQRLYDVSCHMREELIKHDFNILGSNSHIIPVAIGDDTKSAQVKEYLLRDGFVSSFFGYPAVKRGNSIVRFSLCSDVTKEEVDKVIASLLSARKVVGF